MKQKMILIGMLALFLGNLTLLAQPKSTLSISVGPAIPMGRYAQKDTSSVMAFGSITNMRNGAGFAKIGYSISGEYQYRINKKDGLILRFKWQQNSVNSDALKQNLLQKNTWATVASLSNSMWSSGSLLIGGYHTIPIKRPNNKMDVQLKVLAGVLKSSIPSTTYSLSNYPTTMVSYGFQEKQSLGLGFSFLTSAGLAYHITKQFDLLANIEYSNAFLQTTYFKVINYNGLIILGDPYAVHFNFSTLGLSIGAGFKF